MRSKSWRNCDTLLVTAPFSHCRRCRWLASKEEGASGGGDSILGADKGGGEAVQFAAILRSGH